MTHCFVLHIFSFPYRGVLDGATAAAVAVPGALDCFCLRWITVPACGVWIRMYENAVLER
jgi:hypothetical protein